ncbi:hypothetical protein [Niallia circulans]|uniref:Pectate lyase superfamily protein domain-containing protein n=1 Tax=Niallia circulans TaxID=1397 RepID=A0A941G8B7_NIACI|nr:hypothetical protein [Niallia circulans]MCB5235516.1 hypothetical protein [Niallia circulans]
MINSIYDGLDAVNKETEVTSNKQTNLDATFEQLIINAGDSNAEVVAARHDNTNGETFDTLPKRLDATSAQLATMDDLLGDKNGFTDLNWITPDVISAILDARKFIMQLGVNVRMPPYNAPCNGSDDDAVIIRQALQDVGENGRVYMPKPSIAYRINSPVYYKSGQRIDSSPNTPVHDYTGDYAFQAIGGVRFADDAIKNIGLRNLNIMDKANGKGGVKLKNVYLVDLDFIKTSGYANSEAKTIHIDDFFQVNLRTVQVNANPNGHGIYVDTKTGNSGQLNLYNTIVQRCKRAMEIAGSGNLIDGITMIGGAFGNNYELGLKIGKNVYNVTMTGIHFENHDGVLYSGTTALDMTQSSGTAAEGVTIQNCFFINNKYGIVSNGTKRVVLLGNQFDGRSIAGSVAITQGANDAGWIIGPQYITGVTTDIIPNGVNHINLMKLKISSDGVIFPQANEAGIYSGAGSPEGVVQAEIGSIYLRTDGEYGRQFYNKGSGTGKTGWSLLTMQLPVFTNANRPGASTVKPGTQIWNSDDKAPNYSDGSIWLDAMGNIT